MKEGRDQTTDLVQAAQPAFSTKAAENWRIFALVGHLHRSPPCAATHQKLPMNGEHRVMAISKKDETNGVFDVFVMLYNRLRDGAATSRWSRAKKMDPAGNPGAT
jgi:hypothetical protein